jgi:two-component system response regulator YesN
MKRKSVLLVDDEAIVRVGLSRKLSWQKLGLKLVGTAANGREALELLQRHSVDIVVTDILMPDVDGLALIEKAQKMSLPPKFLILSGYDEFEFAQRAMRLGVRYYVLKPTRLQEMENVLRKICSEIDCERRDQSRMITAEEAIDKSRSMLRSSALKLLISSRSITDEQRKLVERCLDIKMDRDRLALVLLDIRGRSSSYSSDVHLITERTFGEVSLLGSIESDGYICQFLRDIDQKKLPGMLEELCGRIRKLAEARIAVVYTQEVPIDELCRQYSTALSHLQKTFYFDKSTVVQSSGSVSGFSEEATEPMVTALKEVDRAVRTGDRTQAKELLGDALSLARQYLLRPSVLRCHCIELLLKLSKDLGPDVWEMIREYIPHLEESQSLAELESGMSLCLGKLCSELRKLTCNPQTRMVEILKDAVRQRYGEHGLSLKMLSRTVVFANVDYLSRLFHRITGERFSEYLIRVRMSEAKRLISSFPFLSVAELAQRVGYDSNTQYFSSAFNKHAGMAPSAYRKTVHTKRTF